MELFCPIILILFGTVDRLWNHFPMSDAIATQLIGHDLSRLSTVTSQKPSEEPLRRSPIPSDPQKYINNRTILIDSSPQIMLLASNLHKDFVHVESITKPSMLSLWSSGIVRYRFDTAKPDRFVTDGDTAFSE